MKRCPQCEFIYEDDQSLCDMDGVLLVFDARTLPSVLIVAGVLTVGRLSSGPTAHPANPRATLIEKKGWRKIVFIISHVWYLPARRAWPRRVP